MCMTRLNKPESEKGGGEEKWSKEEKDWIVFEENKKWLPLPHPEDKNSPEFCWPANYFLFWLRAIDLRPFDDMD